MISGGRRRAIELVGWLVAAGAGLLMLTQAVGWNGFEALAPVQALTPYVIVGLAPLAVAASVAGTHRLAVTTALIGIAGLILAAPLVFPAGQPSVDPVAQPIDVAAVNLLYTNPIIGAAADDLASRDLDAILFTEYTAEHQVALLAHPISAQFPFKIERDGLLAGGIAMWSRYPIDEGERPETTNYTLDVELVGPDGTIRVFGVHPPTPFFRFDGWVDDLATFSALGAAAEQPTLIIGDFNASYWHPPFRDVLANGFSDAHIAHGKGFSTSWPTDKSFPAFVRLDHALTGNGLVSTGVTDFDVPGSDHRGLVVSVAPAR